MYVIGILTAVIGIAILCNTLGPLSAVGVVFVSLGSIAAIAGRVTDEIEDRTGGGDRCPGHTNSI